MWVKLEFLDELSKVSSDDITLSSHSLVLDELEANEKDDHGYFEASNVGCERLNIKHR